MDYQLAELVHRMAMISNILTMLKRMDEDAGWDAETLTSYETDALELMQEETRVAYNAYLEKVRVETAAAELDAAFVRLKKGLTTVLMPKGW